MCAGSPPPAPDYVGQAQQQGASNLTSSIAGAILNRPSEITPFGTRSWNQTGTFDWGGIPERPAIPGQDPVYNDEGQLLVPGTAPVPGAPGQPSFSIPRFESRIEFTPEGKQLFDADMRTRLGLADLQEGALSRSRDAMSSPLDFSGVPGIKDVDSSQGRNAVTDAMYRRAKRHLDPQFDMERRRSDVNAINRGFSVGGEGYTRMMDDQARREEAAYGDARDRAIQAGSQEAQNEFGRSVDTRRQAIVEMLQQRSQPLQELASIRTGAAPSAPQFANTTPAQTPGAAPIAQAGQLAGQYGTDVYNANVSQSNANTQAAMSAATLAAMYMF